MATSGKPDIRLVHTARKAASVVEKLKRIKGVDLSGYSLREITPRGDEREKRFPPREFAKGDYLLIKHVPSDRVTFGVLEQVGFKYNTANSISRTLDVNQISQNQSQRGNIRIPIGAVDEVYVVQDYSGVADKIEDIRERVNSRYGIATNPLDWQFIRQSINGQAYSSSDFNDFSSEGRFHFALDVLNKTTRAVYLVNLKAINFCLGNRPQLEMLVVTPGNGLIPNVPKALYLSKVKGAFKFNGEVSENA